MKRIKQLCVAAIMTAAAFVACPPGAFAQEQAAANQKAFRPPAVPLVTFNPYLSIWSESDHLNHDVTRHWTRHPNSLVSLIRIDDKTYRLMGKDPKDAAAFPQTGVQVLPTRSIYNFDDLHVHVTLTFMTPALPQDLEALSLPLSYITWDVKSADGASHKVEIYDSTSSQLAVNSTKQKVAWAREPMGDLSAMRIGTVEQTLLAPMGDDTRIDWGYAYAVAPAADAKSAIGADEVLTRQFIENGQLPTQDDAQMPRSPGEQQPVMAFAMDLGAVAAQPVSRHVIVAYDEIWSIKYFGKKLPPFWRRNGGTPADMLHIAEHQYPSLVHECTEFDTELMADLTKEGGARYAQIAALSYRQCLAGCGLAADANKQPLLFTKENTSNGDIATVDVIFPMDPMMVFFSPTLAKASLVSNLMYSASPHWKFPNAPHDLGTYPIVMGRDDGGEGMPVEESGNMIILCDAIAQEEGSAEFVKEWWPQLTQWATYLEKYGLDPENQLCTDDFMGLLAHNSNLSVKAILALGAYGDLCKMRGDAAGAERYMAIAKTDAAHWMKVADAGDHSLLAFDKPNTWSQKYNLVWDKILGLNIFPPTVARKEIAFYKTVLQKYGLPLDSRKNITKTDWSVWSATMAEKQSDFEALVSPIWDYLDQTNARDPLADLYATKDLDSRGTMHARPVVGGIFIKMLDNRAMWKKWSSKDTVKAGPWAPLPLPPHVLTVVPASQRPGMIWKYTTDRPVSDWYAAGYDDSGWQEGPGIIGNGKPPHDSKMRTPWTSSDVWVRRQFTMPAGNFHNLQFLVYHDEDVQIYINGVLAATATEFNNEYETMDIGAAAKALLKPGAQITLAAHCHQTEGGQGVDIGLVDVTQP
jgi:hypothetical protein